MTGTIDLMKPNAISQQIRKASAEAGKQYHFNESHNENEPADLWFQESHEGLILFIVFYSRACRWSRCMGCNLPAQMSQFHVPFSALMNQVDHVFSREDVRAVRDKIRKVIISNNGSILDQETFSSTALMYLLARININLTQLKILTIETRPEYVEFAELEFIARALSENSSRPNLEIAVGFEAFDDRIRNDIFDKGLSLETFEMMVKEAAPFGYHFKIYFMQKPVPGISDGDAVTDIKSGIDYLSGLSRRYNIRFNMHLNPTYVASGTQLETRFRQGDYTPPTLTDVARAALHAETKPVSVFIGLSDENLAVPGGSFIRPGDESVVESLEKFNRTQNFCILSDLVQNS